MTPALDGEASKFSFPNNECHMASSASAYTLLTELNAT